MFKGSNIQAVGKYFGKHFGKILLYFSSSSISKPTNFTNLIRNQS
jgi:hypothetical protein